MSTEAFGDRVREVLDSALERPRHEREAFVAGVCGPDDRLQGEVVSLLRALETGGDALEPPALRQPPPAEPLTGLKFGVYHVAERIGEGGMGVVYRAQDTRLRRTVAVKALPPSVARDAHARARFEHEARVLASLNHPNIATIHGVEETARGPVMVLEFVPGESLAGRLTRGRLPIDEALAIAVQIARGLEAAHAAGVVHRDLKPPNIQISADETVKILDFGIAKSAPNALAVPGPRSDTGPHHTGAGGVIGTAGYMSPEQARGRPVDRRADMWAFGCVLYEMLSGRRAFEGDTTSDTVAAVLRAEPDWSRLPFETPRNVARLLRRCLEKEVDRRQRDAGDARIELEYAEPPVGTPARPRMRVLTWSAIIAAIVALAFAAGLLLRSDRAPHVAAGAGPVRFAIDLPRDMPLSHAIGGNMAISPDGGMLAYSSGPVDRPQLYLRPLSGLEAAPLAGTEGAVTPFFSPDGRWVGFVAGAAVVRTPVAGGPREVVVPGGVAPHGCAWGDDGAIIFCDYDGIRLRRVPATGGEPELLHEPDPSNRRRGRAHPEVLPGARAILYTAVLLEGERYDSHVEALVAPPSRGARQHRVLVPSAACARFVPPDRLVYWQAGTLMIAPFDPDAVRITGEAAVAHKPLAGGEVVPMPRFAVPGPVASGDAPGVLAWLPGNVTYDLVRLSWFDPDGTATVVTEGTPAIDGPRLSPDGTRIAVLIGASGGDVWVHDLARSTRIRLTTGDFRLHAVWMPDGDRIACVYNPPGERVRVEWMPVDGGAPPETLIEAPQGGLVYPTDAVPGSRDLILTYRDAASPLDVCAFDTQTRAPPRRLLPAGPDRYGARVSPDAALIAYTSEETGTEEVYLHRYPSLASKIRVSTNGGYRPVWSRDGKQLFFRYLNRLSVVDVQAPRSDTGAPAAPLTVSRPRVLFEHLPDARYEVSADGRRFLMARPSGDWGPQTRINLAVGWNPRSP